MNARRSWWICLVGLVMLALNACSSLPEGAAAPKLAVQGISVANTNGSPVFVINYTLEHASATPLPLLSVKASVFLGDRKVATLDQQYHDFNLEPNTKHALTLEVPANLAGDAGLDSFANNPLLVLQGSCAIQARFSADEKLKQFNPSTSYAGFIRSANR